jgi:hypothetical protein
MGRMYLSQLSKFWGPPQVGTPSSVRADQKIDVGLRSYLQSALIKAKVRELVLSKNKLRRRDVSADEMMSTRESSLRESVNTASDKLQRI